MRVRSRALSIACRLVALSLVFLPFPVAASPDPASDDFERASLGPNWTVWFGSGNCGIVGSSDLGMINFNAMCGASWTADTFSADSFSEGVISANKDPDMMGQAFVRRRSSDNARYGLHYNNESTMKWEIKYDGVPSAQTRIVANASGAAPLPGDTIRIEIVGQTLRGFHNGVEVVNGTDTAPDAITTAGPAGLVYRLKLGSSATYPTPMFESWRGGSLPVLPEATGVAAAGAAVVILAGLVLFAGGRTTGNSIESGPIGPERRLDGWQPRRRSKPAERPRSGRKELRVSK
ncbi:MAG TPA: hypothetical protein VI893_10240 [Thermoplasmata archaeon]|nr:hypothetical protein [Thermoplasmata archaeon]